MDEKAKVWVFCDGNRRGMVVLPGTLTLDQAIEKAREKGIDTDGDFTFYALLVPGEAHFELL